MIYEPVIKNNHYLTKDGLFSNKLEDAIVIEGNLNDNIKCQVK